MKLKVADFEKIRREPLLEYAEYEELNDFFCEDDSYRYDLLKDNNNELTHRVRISWSMVSSRFQRVLLNYSAGNKLDEVNTLSDVALRELQRHKSDFNDENFLFWEQDSFQFLLWCLSFVALTGKTESLSTITRMYGTSPEVSGEACMAQLFRLFNVQGIPDSSEEALVFPKSYQHLYNAIKTGPLEPSKKEREESVKAYLRGWYKGMKDCYWHNRHKGRFPTFFGYWSLEAAMVTLLFNLDDSSYNHLPYYPKDWVEEARKQGFDKSLSKDKLPPIYIAFPDTPCPITGLWQSNLTSDVTSLKEGETMPGPIQDDNETAYFWVSKTS